MNRFYCFCFTFLPAVYVVTRSVHCDRLIVEDTSVVSKRPERLSLPILRVFLKDSGRDTLFHTVTYRLIYFVSKGYPLESPYIVNES